MDRLIATVFGLGKLRPAPGTIASAVAILLGVALHWLGNFPLVVVATLIATFAGFWAVRRASVGMADKDPADFVIDEFAGQWLALCFPSFGFWLMGMMLDRQTDLLPYPGWLAAFIFFRIFDIWKPWLIGRADRRHDADGIMLDDLWAGLFAGIATVIAAGIGHGLMRMAY